MTTHRGVGACSLCAAGFCGARSPEAVGGRGMWQDGGAAPRAAPPESPGPSPAWAGSHPRGSSGPTSDLVV